MTDGQGNGNQGSGNLGSGLDGAVVAVAGGAGPAGAATVRALAAAGATVVAADRDLDRLDAAVAAANEAAGGAGAAAGEFVDLLDTQAVRDWAARIETLHGRIDGLVHLVGGWRGGRDLTPSAVDDWEFLEPLLVRTLANTSTAFREPLLKSGGRGRFVLVSQSGAARPTAGNAAYAAAKSAAEAWTLALGDSFRKAAKDAPGGPSAAAAILVVKALVHQAMRDESPDRKFPGYTDVDDLAARIAGLWDASTSTNDVNGQRIWLTEQ